MVELQSYTWHSDRAAFERDHRKLAVLKRAGLETLALTHRQVTGQGDWVVETIAALLSAQPAAGSRARAG